MPSLADATEQASVHHLKYTLDSASGWHVRSRHAQEQQDLAVKQQHRKQVHAAGVAYDAQLLLVLVRKGSLQSLQREWDVLFWPEESLNSVVEGGPDGSERTTPLIEAVKMGRDDVVGFLLERRADPALKDGGGRTAVDWARKLRTCLGVDVRN